MKILLSLQVFFTSLIQSLLTVGKIVILSRFVKLPKAKSSEKEVVILGNGPSLTGFVNEHRYFLDNKLKLVVNHFADTELYESIKPEMYVINAIEFWSEGVDKDVIERRNRLIDNIIKKTQWEMSLFLGMKAKKSKAWKRIEKENKNIKVYYFNVTPVEGFEKFKMFCYKYQLGMPRPHNILIPSIMLVIKMGYKKVYIAGADHSWLQELYVAEDNTAYLNQKHFYDIKTSKPEIMKKAGKNKRKLHEILHKFYLTFKGYFDVANYAKKQGVAIYNVTKNTYIDAFERLKLQRK